jgi:hypothetical protein
MHKRLKAKPDSYSKDLVAQVPPF